MAVELPDEDSGSTTSSVAEAGFMTIELDPVGCGPLPGKCDGGGPIGGVGELALQVGDELEGWYFDTGAIGQYDA